MANLPLNTFKTITSVVPTQEIILYTAPVGISTVFLMAQVTNIGPSYQSVTFSHKRGNTTTEIVKDYSIPDNDTLTLLPGKLVLESGDSISVIGSSSTDLKFIASILETSNQ